MKRELLNQLLASALLAAAAAAALVFSVPPLAVVLCLAGALAVLNMAFTVVRYRKISQLTADLREVSSGRDRLHLEEYEEGELSILSSEIYKLTVQLREQASLLQEDKLFLERNLSDISHQLKTPLTSLSVMNDLLRDENLPAHKRKEFLDRCRNRAPAAGTGECVAGGKGRGGTSFNPHGITGAAVFCFR